MKKYWKLIMLALFAFSLLGIHYVQGAREMNDYLTLSLETIRGDESVVQDRTFYGYYSQSYFDTLATVTLEGYKTPFKSLFGMNDSYSPEMQDLLKQYHSFMRGKIYDPIYYYEDEERLLYVEVPMNNRHIATKPITFNVSMLNKRDGKTSDFKAITGQSFPFDYVHVEKVQFVDGYIKVIVSARAEDDDSVLYVITIDETKREVIEYTPLMMTNPGEDYVFHFMYNDYLFAPQTNFLYGSSSEYIDLTPGGMYDKEISEMDFKLYKINIKTMINEPIDVPEALQRTPSITVATNEATHFVIENLYTTELYSYYFDDNEWKHVELESRVAVEDAFVVNDVLYITNEDDTGKTLIDAFDVVTGKHLYSGKITSKNDEPFDFRMSSVK